MGIKAVEMFIGTSLIKAHNRVNETIMYNKLRKLKIA